MKAAQGRRGKVTSVDKANVLATSRLWRRTMIDVAKDYPDVSLNHFYVDNCAMQLALNPKQFDVIVTGNLFGDILSDEAAVLGGSIGMMPSASIGELTSLYEPIHGSRRILQVKALPIPVPPSCRQPCCSVTLLAKKKGHLSSKKPSMLPLKMVGARPTSIKKASKKPIRKR